MIRWDAINQLAKCLLGDAALKPQNFSDIETRIIPEEGQRQVKKYSSYLEPLADIEILPEYSFILQALEQGCPSIFVTGKAGTGKSTLIRWLCQQLPSCAVVAPTAIAAVNVQGDTLHAFFGLPPTHIDPDDHLMVKDKTRVVLENLRYLIIDEVSMVLPSWVDVMDRTLQRVRKTPHPFGGVPTIFVGDLLQLPPVITSKEEMVYFSHRYRTQHFFSADVFKQQNIIPVNLSKVRRQADAEFIEALNRIRLNDQARDAVALFNRRCFRDKPETEKNGIYLVPTNQVAKQINTRELEALSSEAKIYQATITGTLTVNQWKIAIPDRLELKVGAKVIFLKNKKPQWINGDLGEVLGLDEDHIRIKKQASDNVLLVEREVWIKYQYTYNYDTQKIEKQEVGTFRQFPLALGWAITIHKSQGLTLERLQLDLGRGAFCAGQTYVALSRAKTLDGISLTKPIAMQDVRADAAVVAFYRQLGIE
jgi:ATP-dependent exoDNAse (exonuclease V) alpha subunit